MNPYSPTSLDDSKHELERALFVERSPEAYQRRIKHLRASGYKVSLVPEDESLAVSAEVAYTAQAAFQPSAAPRKLEDPQIAKVIQFPNRQLLGEGERTPLDAPKTEVTDLNAYREQKQVLESKEKQGMMDEAHHKLAELFEDAG